MVGVAMGNAGGADGADCAVELDFQIAGGPQALHYSVRELVVLV